jgi:hypothetical protein
MNSPPSLAARHLLLRLRPIARALRAAVARQTAAAARLTRPDLTELCITGEQVELLLDTADASLDDTAVDVAEATLSADEQADEQLLRDEAAAAGQALPLDRLTSELELTAFELEALLVCAAPEVDRSFERIIAYVLDDLQRRMPCVELMAALTAPCESERLARRASLGRFGRLRRLGLLRPLGEAPTEWRQELRLGRGVLELLLGQVDTLALWRDPAEVELPARIALPADVEAAAVERLGTGLASGDVQAVGVWGAARDGEEEVVLSLAGAAGRPLRRLVLPLEPDPEPAVRDAIEAASAVGAILWITSDPLRVPAAERARATLVALLGACPVPVIVSGVHPWRPAAWLSARAYAELRLPSASFRARKTLWKAALPELSDEDAADRAARFSLAPVEVRAVARTARTAAGVHEAPAATHLDEASALVTRRQIDHLARVVTPTRTPTELVLPPELHRQVMEVAQFFRVWPRVSEEWGLGRAIASNRGVKALFTGEPGTGKTLAAEVIAGSVGLPLFKVDLAQVVSKWVGETEKNLECVFREAEESHAVLFFDEADALFGKRGEVQHGTDRYANLEVSYLLQRLEAFEGLVILASNLKDQIDVAFTRRFQIVLHFPRPREDERLQIWRAALPTAADPGIDFDRLARLDMTGAGIVNSVRTAALLAAHAGASTIEMPHIVEAVARQFRREARVLTAGDLGGPRMGVGSGRL